MRNILLAVLLLGVLALGTYWYRSIYSVCRVPVLYSIGTIDDRFNMSREEVRVAVTEAESLWEDAAGRNLFTYDEGAAFTINFVFDDRQETTYEERGLREILNQKEDVSETIRQEYEQLLVEYGALKSAYEERVNTYESNLASYNEEVERWNSAGGAPPDVFEQLGITQEKLAAEREKLNAVVDDLNNLVDAINELGKRGNETVQEYNADVSTYNDRFTEAREFTQGDYQGDAINIYQFDDVQELRLVLAHELGHALSLEHVEDERSIMYFLMEGQLADHVLSADDLAEFKRVCGDGSQGVLPFVSRLVSDISSKL